VPARSRDTKVGLQSLGMEVASFDPETQVALAWFASFGFEAKPSGDLIAHATAKDTSLDHLFQANMFDDFQVFSSGPNSFNS
jgi:hypothetical protein